MTIKKLLAALLGICLAASLCACGDPAELAADLTGDMTSKEAQALAEGNLNVIFRNRFDQDYLDSVGLTREEARGEFDEGVELEIQFCEEYFGIEYDTPEIHRRLREFYNQVYPLTEFQVGEAARLEDGSFSMPVNIRPLDVMERAYSLLEDRIEDFNSQYDDQTVEAMDEAAYMEYDARWAELVLSALEESLGEMDYLTERSVQVTVDQSTGFWMLTDDSISAVDDLLIAY